MEEMSYEDFINSDISLTMSYAEYLDILESGLGFDHIDSNYEKEE